MPNHAPTVPPRYSLSLNFSNCFGSFVFIWLLFKDKDSLLQFSLNKCQTFLVDFHFLVAEATQLKLAFLFQMQFQECSCLECTSMGSYSFHKELEYVRSHLSEKHLLLRYRFFFNFIYPFAPFLIAFTTSLTPRFTFLSAIANFKWI